MGKETINLPSGRKGVVPKGRPEMTDEHKKMVDEMNKGIEQHKIKREKRKKSITIIIAIILICLIILLIYLLRKNI